MSGKVELGDRILAEGELKDIETGGFYSMPCPGSAPGGMSIFGESEDHWYVEAFCEGHDVEFFAGVGDKIVIKYGGDVELKYRVTEDALEEYGVTLEDYGVTLEDYGRFVEKLREMGLAVCVVPKRDQK